MHISAIHDLFLSSPILSSDITVPRDGRWEGRIWWDSNILCKVYSHISFSVCPNCNYLLSCFGDFGPHLTLIWCVQEGLGLPLNNNGVWTCVLHQASPHSNSRTYVPVAGSTCVAL